MRRKEHNRRAHGAPLGEGLCAAPAWEGPQVFLTRAQPPVHRELQLPEDPALPPPHEDQLVELWELQEARGLRVVGAVAELNGCPSLHE